MAYSALKLGVHSSASWAEIEELIAREVQQHKEDHERMLESMLKQKPGPATVEVRAVSIRPYRPGDWEAFLALDLETGALGLGPAEREAFRARWPALLRGKLGFADDGPTQNAGALFVLEEQGEYAGHLWVSEQEDLFSGERSLFVATIAVDARFRGRGFGRLLMQHAELVARERGLGSVVLGVVSDNAPAISLYESLGYATTRRSMRKRL
jgi:ribosomal protein S18 acetylase RimI-like enzyme